MVQDTRSLEEIKRDTERSRAALTETVDQLRTSVEETASELRERISPRAIKAEMADYFESRGEALVARVKDTVRNNPVQAVAVGAALGYPLLKLLRAIPAPVLMVGAGLYLAGSKTGQAVTQKASDAAVDFAGEVERRAREFTHDAVETATAAGQYAAGSVQAATDAATSRASQFRQAAASSAAEIRGKADDYGKTIASGVDDLRRRATAAGEAFAAEAGDIADKGVGLSEAVAGTLRDTAASVRDAAGSVRDSAADAAARVRSTIGETADAGRDAALKARDRAAALGDQAGRSLVDTISNNPLLVAGIGLVVGGLIASALPRLRVDKKMFTEAGDELSRRARDTVVRGADTVMEAAGAVVQSVSGGAEQSSAAASLAEAPEDIGPRLRKVADASKS